jgi:hypothetical protein
VNRLRESGFRSSTELEAILFEQNSASDTDATESSSGQVDKDIYDKRKKLHEEIEKARAILKDRDLKRDGQQNALSYYPGSDGIFFSLPIELINYSMIYSYPKSAFQT